MTTVFIGGSRAISRLNRVIRERLDDLIAQGCTIYVGDANGADRTVQQHLAGRGYQKVVVFCMDKCRNNVGGWPARKINLQTDKRDFAYYATKDIVMSQEAKCGVMLWDGKSKGTLHNILNLLKAGKKALVYFAPTRDFHKISNEQDLSSLLARCDKKHLDHAERRLGVKASLQQQYLPLHTS